MERNKNTNQVTCSAPGKVLITGGYLVLDRPNGGFVVSVNARFYSSISNIGKDSLKGTKGDGIIIQVSSPQFHTNQFYSIQLKNQCIQLKSIEDNQKENPYVEKTIVHCISLARELTGDEKVLSILGEGLLITIEGDNGFYSQKETLEEKGLPLNSSSLVSLPPRSLFSSASLSSMRKTGLGSSAALVTSLSAALLSFFNVVNLPNPEDPAFSALQQSGNAEKVKSLHLVHNMAQFCHCLAQGKIGSGFDVSSAVFGSQRYVRFSPSILQPLLSQENPVPNQVLQIVQSDWDSQAEPITLPPHFKLVLGDVSKGSNTPNMVSKVLEWKKSHPEADLLIRRLSVANDEVGYYFQNIQKISEDEEKGVFLHSLKKCAKTTADKWTDATSNPLGQKLFKLRFTFEEIRKLLRTVGKQANVEIEPVEQQKLSDETMAIPGVLISGVPGAGGYDAIFAILFDDSAFEKVEQLWTSKGVTTLVVEEEGKGVLRDLNFQIKSNL